MRGRDIPRSRVSPLALPDSSVNPSVHVIVAPDSFKGCLSAREVADAIEAGILAACPDASITSIPLADGGEGTVEALVTATDGEYVPTTVTGPLGEPVEAVYGILGDARTAVIEMAAASGLPLVPPNKRNPLLTTTYGTGELIRHALRRGCRRIIVGVGGSATVDGGAGMAQALGIRLLDGCGRDIPRGGRGLGRLERIDPSASVIGPGDTREFLVAADVTNPLLGDEGAARVYGPQKGATPEMIDELEAGLARLAQVLRRDLDRDVANIPGAGAAGGLGAGLAAFLGAEIRRGAELVIEASGLCQHLKGADLVVTGEGRLDAQTAFGKTPAAVAAAARDADVPVIALAGSVAPDALSLHAFGIAAMLSVAHGPIALDEAMRPETARDLIARSAEQLLRALLATRTRRSKNAPQDESRARGETNPGTPGIAVR